MTHNTSTNHDSLSNWKAIRDALASELVTRAKIYAIQCHSSTNHTYDGRPYEYHLQMAFDYGVKFGYLLPKDTDFSVVFAAIWAHDVIEDCRQTYNDVVSVLGVEVADIVYALTNEKGKNRRERANDSYYNGICSDERAIYAKLCDRLANTKHSHTTKSKMLGAYKKEFNDFLDKLYKPSMHVMWAEMARLLA